MKHNVDHKTTSQQSRLGQLLRSKRIWLLSVVLLTVPFVFSSAGTALATRNNDVRQWLPGGFDETRQYDWFLEHFGSEEFAIVSWQGASLDDARVPKLASRLRTFTAGNTQPELFADVLTAEDLITRLTTGKLSLTRDEASVRLQGSLLGPDGMTTGIVVRLTAAG